jgi:nicotinamide-nucleotide amidase
MSSNKKVEIINLGDELLLGVRDNSHLTFLGSRLSQYGVSVRRCLVIRDRIEEVEKYFKDAWESSDIVITTGGLGPTSDDITKETIAKILGVELTLDSGAKKALDQRYRKLGVKLGENSLKQCYKLKGGESLPNPFGTAPGIFYKEKKSKKILIMLPGPTREMEPMFNNEIVPLLRKEKVIQESDDYLQLRTIGVRESELDTIVGPIIAKTKHVTVSYCAHEGIIDVRLSSDDDKKADAEAINEVANAIKDKIGNNFICFGRYSIAELIAYRLRSMERTLSIAESCTGGLLSSAFTDIPGISSTFLGGITCYSDESKVQMVDVPEDLISQHSSVSEETAMAMATGVSERFDTDYGLSVTGYAGPDGGTIDDPVGTVYIGLHSRKGVWVNKVKIHGSRSRVKVRAVNMALDWMRRKLDQSFLADLVDFIE